MSELVTNTQTDPKSPPLLTLPAAALELVEASVSPNTRRVYSSVWRRFDEFQRNRLGGLEADDAGVAAYLTALFEAGSSAATAGLAVAALRFQARHTGESDPVGPLSERVLAGFRRSATDRGRGQVTAIRHSVATPEGLTC